MFSHAASRWLPMPDAAQKRSLLTSQTPNTPASEPTEFDNDELDKVAGGRKAGEGQKDWPDPPLPPPPPPKI